MNTAKTAEKQDQELESLFWKIENFFQDHPSKRWIHDLKQLYKGVRKLLLWSLKDLDEKEFFMLLSFSVSGFFLDCYLKISKWSLPKSEYLFLIKVEEKLDLIRDEIEKRKIEQLVARPTKKNLFKILGLPIFKTPVQQLEELLWKNGFTIHYKRNSREKSLFLIESPKHYFYFIDSVTGVSYAGKQLNDYNFWKNKVYKFVRKVPRKIETIKSRAIHLLAENPKACLETFLRTLMPSSLVQQIAESRLEVSFWSPLKTILDELPLLFSRFNLAKFQREEEFLFLQDSECHLSPLGHWKKIYPPQEAKHGFHWQEAIFFEVEKQSGKKGILVTNGNQTEYFPL